MRRAGSFVDGVIIFVWTLLSIAEVNTDFITQALLKGRCSEFLLY